MPNPWLVLSICLIWIASLAGAYHKGAEHTENKLRAEHAKQLEATIADHNANAVIDMEAALEAGKREAIVKTKVVTLNNEVEKLIYAKPSPADCRLQPDTFKLFNAAVQIANGADKDTTGAVPNGTGKAAPAGKP